MGLYDNYQLANSTRIREYQGSTVPELVKVNQELQKRYDMAAEGQDYIARFLQGMDALPQDKQALNEVANQYTSRLQTLAGRPDLENALRETTLLGRDVPEAYAPFAQRMKDFQARKAQIEKDVQDGKITPQTAQRIMQMDQAMDPGVQKDPRTGRYTGRYNGSINYMKDIDTDKKVDEWMDKALPSTQGWSKEFANGQWIIKKAGKRVVMDKDRIAQIIAAGAAADGEYQAWARQQQQLGSFDYNPARMGDINFDQQLGSIRQKDAAGKEQLVPVTLGDVLNQYQQQGISTADALKAIRQQQIGNDLMSKMQNYGVVKYIRDDREEESGLEANQVWKWNQEEAEKKAERTMLQMATTMTLGGANIEDVRDFTKIQSGLEDEHTGQMTAYTRWLKGLDDGKQKITSNLTGKVYYKDENGTMVDVTADAENFRSSMQDIDNRRKELEMIDAAAKRAAGFDKLPPSLVKKAEDARKEAEKATSSAEASLWGIKIASGGGTGGAAINYTDAQRKRNGEAAYKAVLEDTEPFRKYEKELAARMKGTTMGSDLFTFRDEKTIDNLSKTAEALISGLDLEKGMVPVQFNDGSQLSADQWGELKGSMRAIGVTFTGDVNSPIALVMRAFKDVKNKKTSGEDMIIKLPNTNIQQIASESMDEEQKDYLRRASGLAVALNNPTRSFDYDGVTIQANTNDPRKGWQVRIGDKEATLYSFKDIFNFMDSNR